MEPPGGLFTGQFTLYLPRLGRPQGYDPTSCQDGRSLPQFLSIPHKQNHFGGHWHELHGAAGSQLWHDYFF